MVVRAELRARILESALVSQVSWRHLALTLAEAYSLTLCLCTGVLAGGRVVEVAFDEWPFYRQNPQFIPALWLEHALVK